MDLAYIFISHFPAMAEDIPIQTELRHNAVTRSVCITVKSPTYPSFWLYKMQSVRYLECGSSCRLVCLFLKPCLDFQNIAVLVTVFLCISHVISTFTKSSQFCQYGMMWCYALTLAYSSFQVLAVAVVVLLVRCEQASCSCTHWMRNVSIFICASLWSVNATLCKNKLQSYSA